MRNLELGLVGVGAMGLPIGRRLIEAGHKVSAVETSPERKQQASRAGMTIKPALDVLSECDYSFIMVASGDQLANVVEAFTSSKPQLKAQRTWIVMSTVGVPAVKAAQAALEPFGVAVVDAPVTGGVAGATSGTMTIFVATSQTVFEKLSPLLSELGRPILVGEEPGFGQLVKTINQVLCSIHLVAAAEALALAKAAGLEPARVLGYLANGAAGSWMLDNRGPRMVDPQSKVNSAISIFQKDARLAKELSEALGIQLPVLESALSRFDLAGEKGLANEDDSQVIQTYL